jgi:hypothetical protein
VARPRLFISLERGAITEIASDAEIDVVVFDVDRMKRADLEAYELEQVTVPAEPERVAAALDEAATAIAKLFG